MFILLNCNTTHIIDRYIRLGVARIHSWSGFSAKLECSTLPTQSTIAEVVMDDSMRRMAATASSRVTSFLNMSIACAEKTKCVTSGKTQNWCTTHASSNLQLPWASCIKLSSIRTVVLAAQ